MWLRAVANTVSKRIFKLFEWNYTGMLYLEAGKNGRYFRTF